MKTASLALAGLMSLMIAGCDSANNSNKEQGDTVPAPMLFDFAENDQSFKGIFSDYPVGQATFYELAAEHRSLPEGFADKSGWRVYGNNHSDDLLMAIKGRIAGVSANTLYHVSLNVEFLTNTEGGCFGVGGAPAESVYVKLAAATTEPVNRTDDNNYYRLVTDVGNQANGGTEGEVVGNIANGEECLGKNNYVLKTLATSQGIDVMSDDNGEFWVMALTDSGFEAATEVFYTKLTVTFDAP